MGRKGCNAEKDPRMYVGATPTLGLPLCLLALVPGPACSYWQVLCTRGARMDYSA